MSIYNVYLQGEHWKNFRNETLKKRNKCEKCNSKENLCLHHLTYENLGRETQNDVMILCQDCHKEIHRKTVGSKGRRNTACKKIYFDKLVKYTKNLKDQEVACLVRLSEHINWETGVLTDKRSKRRIMFKDLKRIWNCGSGSVSDKVSSLKGHNILYYDKDGYKISKEFYLK